MLSDRSRLVVVAATVAVLALVAGSCASMTKNEEWTGHKIDEVIAKYGKPSSVLPGENGQKTYTWTLHRSVPVQTQTFNSQGAPMSGTTYRDSVRTKTFSVDASGVITSWNDSQTHQSM